MNLEKIHNLSSNYIKINPYKYVSKLSNEYKKDKYLFDIKMMCRQYLNYEKDDFFEKYTDNYIWDAIEFITTEYKNVLKIQSQFEISDTSNNFLQIGHSLDIITCIGELDEFDERSVYYELGLNLNNLKDNLEFCTLILNKIVKV